MSSTIVWLAPREECGVRNVVENRKVFSTPVFDDVFDNREERSYAGGVSGGVSGAGGRAAPSGPRAPQGAMVTRTDSFRWNRPSPRSVLRALPTERERC